MAGTKKIHVPNATLALRGPRRIAAVAPELHGLATTYASRGCRCGPCIEENSAKGRARRARKAAL
jgi:hypothetical protein